MDCNLPGSSVHGNFQARILEWATISYSRGSSQPRDRIRDSCVPCVSRWVLYHCIIYSSLKRNSESECRLVMSDSLPPNGLYSPWNSPGQNTGVGNVSLFPRIFPIQGSNPGHLHCRQILYCWATREAQVCKAYIWNINSFYLVCDLYDSAYIVQSNKWACMDLLKCIFQRKYKTPGIQVKSGWEVHLLSGNSVLSISAF